MASVGEARLLVGLAALLLGCSGGTSPTETVESTETTTTTSTTTSPVTSVQPASSESTHEEQAVDGQAVAAVELTATTDSGLIKRNPGPDDWVECSGYQFPLRALQDLQPLEALPEIEAAVRPFLDGAEGQAWPQDGWQVAAISDTAAFTFVLKTQQQVRQDAEDRDIDERYDPGFGDGVNDPTVMAGQGAALINGSWEWDGSFRGDECVLETVIPDGLHRVDWTLDPSEPEPTAESTILKLWATEQECVGGQAMGDRLRPPELVETDEAVMIAMVADAPAPPGGTCQGNPHEVVAIELSGPLGDRRLIDGFASAGRISAYVGDAFDLGP